MIKRDDADALQTQAERDLIEKAKGTSKEFEDVYGRKFGKAGKARFAIPIFRVRQNSLADLSCCRQKGLPVFLPQAAL